MVWTGLAGGIADSSATVLISLTIVPEGYTEDEQTQDFPELQSVETFHLALRESRDDLEEQNWGEYTIIILDTSLPPSPCRAIEAILCKHRSGEDFVQKDMKCVLNKSSVLPAAIEE